MGASTITPQMSPVRPLMATLKMGGMNLEVFKFGMYVMFPIGIMFYFGTNLDDRFSVPGFWPKPEECNRIPHDREELRQARAFEEEKRKAAQGGADEGNES